MGECDKPALLVGKPVRRIASYTRAGDTLSAWQCKLRLGLDRVKTNATTLYLVATPYSTE
jgi:hypothetical protein